MGAGKGRERDGSGGRDESVGRDGSGRWDGAADGTGAGRGLVVVMVGFWKFTFSKELLCSHFIARLNNWHCCVISVNRLNYYVRLRFR
jgi:hypothetical protein